MCLCLVRTSGNDEKEKKKQRKIPSPPWKVPFPPPHLIGSLASLQLFSLSPTSVPSYLVLFHCLPLQFLKPLSVQHL